MCLRAGSRNPLGRPALLPKNTVARRTGKREKRSPNAQMRLGLGRCRDAKRQRHRPCQSLLVPHSMSQLELLALPSSLSARHSLTACSFPALSSRCSRFLFDAEEQSDYLKGWKRARRKKLAQRRRMMRGDERGTQ